MAKKDWNVVRPQKSADDIPLTPEVVTWETAYSLPSLVGTPRQVAWARLIRNQMLSELFKTLMDAVAGLDDPKPVYDRVDAMRAEQQATAWINTHRPHLYDAVAYVVG